MASHDDTDLSVEEWNKRFNSPNAEEWLSTAVDKRLVKYEKRLLGDLTHKHKLYVPLCGHSYDMKWAYDKGFEVVGIDCVVPALRKFFDMYNIAYTEQPLDSIKGCILKSTDGKIRLYGCDVADFKGELETGCTAMWDSAAIVALNKGLRKGYVELASKMMAPGGRCILMGLDYDSTVYPGPPHRLSFEEVKELFGDGFDFEILEKTDTMQEMAEMMAEGGTGQEGHEHQPHPSSSTETSASSTVEKTRADTLAEQFMDLKEFWSIYMLVTKKM